MYNLHVEGDQTYFVGKANGGVWVHNTCADNLTTVSRWGREGLKAGDWVMKGGPNKWNYLRSFKWQPGTGNEYAPFDAGQEFQVPASSVKWPTGLGIDGRWKGLFGQRVYTP